jgi:hypothetical protein
MLSRMLWTAGDDFVSFFTRICWLTVGLAAVCLILSWRYFASLAPRAASEPLPEAVP